MRERPGACQHARVSDEAGHLTFVDCSGKGAPISPGCEGSALRHGDELSRQCGMELDERELPIQGEGHHDALARGRNRDITFGYVDVRVCQRIGQGVHGDDPARTIQKRSCQ